MGYKSYLRGCLKRINDNEAIRVSVLKTQRVNKGFSHWLQLLRHTLTYVSVNSGFGVKNHTWQGFQAFSDSDFPEIHIEPFSNLFLPKGTNRLLRSL